MSEQKLKNKVVVEKEGAEMPVERVGNDDRPAHWFKPGQRGGPGRAKGQPNKVTKTIREAILAATQPGQCHPEGLVGWLRERAQGGIEDRKIFGAMVSRALPIEVTGTDGGPIKIDLGWMSQRRIGYGDVVDVIPVTQTPQQLGQAADNTVQSTTYAGGAPDVISADRQDKEDKA